MTNVDYIQILIESERQESRPGWWERIEHLEEQKKLAEIIAEAQDPDFDPFLKYKKEPGGWLRFVKSKFWSIKKKFFN